MIKADLDDAALDKAISTIKGMDSVLAQDFGVAGQLTVDYLVKDLRGGVAVISGGLRSSIVGELVQVVGSEVDMRFNAAAQNNGYDYGMRLDQDGKPTWKSGKYRGSKTYGWFSYVLKRIARKTARRFFLKALEAVVIKLAAQASST